MPKITAPLVRAISNTCDRRSFQGWIACSSMWENRSPPSFHTFIDCTNLLLLPHYNFSRFRGRQIIHYHHTSRFYRLAIVRSYLGLPAYLVCVASWYTYAVWYLQRTCVYGFQVQLIKVAYLPVPVQGDTERRELLFKSLCLSQTKYQFLVTYNRQYSSRKQGNYFSEVAKTT